MCLHAPNATWVSHHLTRRTRASMVKSRVPARNIDKEKKRNIFKISVKVRIKFYFFVCLLVCLLVFAQLTRLKKTVIFEIVIDIVTAKNHLLQYRDIDLYIAQSLVLSRSGLDVVQQFCARSLSYVSSGNPLAWLHQLVSLRGGF